MSESNINDILEINNNHESKIPNGGAAPKKEEAEKILCNIAKIQLWIGLIVAFICFCIIFTEAGQRNEVIGTSCFVGSIVIAVISVATWAILKVFANISTTLKEIKKILNSN